MKKHLTTLSKAPSVAQSSTIEIKLNAVTEILDLLLAANQQSEWKAWFPPETTD